MTFEILSIALKFLIPILIQFELQILADFAFIQNSFVTIDDTVLV